jgi:hypothetical protein
VSGVPIRVVAAPYKFERNEATVALAVEVDASGLGLVEKDGQFVGQLEIGYLAADSRDKVYPGEYHVARLALTPDTLERRTVRVLGEMRLPAGRYQLRVVAGNRAGRAGSVVYDLDIADFSRAELAMSGVAVTSLAASQSVTLRPKESLRDFLPGPLTATREFDAGDTLALFAEIYENVRNVPVHAVNIRAELRTDEGRVLQTVEEERSSSELQGSSGGYGFMAEIPLTGVAPGRYVVHVEASANASERRQVSRDIRIVVR